eukprot:CAMPEP_0204512438 /NCGR_PEP_ID=MMETSP0661-20131031/958_1 /ASSEMBLY_ACC=CAM_ASM_000606 /TAXON_ID=109239 /ORGANISM="Alexandrium margalefi, Strain AMGDE01CS-322" /LENGTH=239 /DNA_ID=CAMNT_0051517557 /DNA_START=78 /DNA_END=797 /DNA_ORIENTATION=-
MRQFLESCPDRFVVIPGEGNEYSVALAPGARQAGAGGAGCGRSLPEPPRQVPTKLPQPLAPPVVSAVAPPASAAAPVPPVAVAPVPPAANAIEPASQQPRPRAQVQWQGSNGARRWQPKVAPSSSPAAPTSESEPTSAPAALPKAPPRREWVPVPAKVPLPAKAPVAERPRWEDLAEEAVHRIEEQLNVPKSGGFVWIQNWNQRYLRHLGTLRGFMESRLERFKVIPLSGKGYRVELVQ